MQSALSWGTAELNLVKEKCSIWIEAEILLLCAQVTRGTTKNIMAERSRGRRNRDRREYVPEKKRAGKAGKRIAIGIGAVILATAAGVGGYCTYDRIMDDKTMGCKISVYGVNVSWLTVEDAATKLEEKFQDTTVEFDEKWEKGIQRFLKRCWLFVGSGGTEE